MSNYNKKIKSIMNYFSISEPCAKYIFHRRKRGSPWKKEYELNYLKWDIKLQNALIKADNTNLDWSSLEFNKEKDILFTYGIILDDQPIVPITNETNDINDEWTIVNNRKNKSIQKKIIRTLGLLPDKL